MEFPRFVFLGFPKFEDIRPKIPPELSTGGARKAPYGFAMLPIVRLFLVTDGVA